MTHSQHSDRRLFLASTLLILAGIGLFVALLQVAAAVIIPPHPLTFRVLFIGLAASLLLASACLVLRDTSALWQIPLQAFAAAMLVLGVSALVTAAFYNWHTLIGGIGVRAVTSIAIGIGAAWLICRLQVRLLPQQDT
jgi:hypothetical protein